MRSDSFKSSGGSAPGGSTPRRLLGRGKSAASATHPPRVPQTPEEEIPTAPPEALRPEYGRVSRNYVLWCCGMLVWSILCVVYFVMTHQTTNMIIGLCLGVLLVAMIVLPAMLFGGATWYKRLGWMMLLLGLFSAMWVYPVIVIGYGIRKRIAEGRYHHMTVEDVWHAVLSALTVAVATWTIAITWRCGRLVRKLYKGEFGETEVSVRR